jgi:murein DD-endopeptidase MepM/ murein hydrolase activator NlpD
MLRWRKAGMFAAGAVLPIAGVALLLLGKPKPLMISAAEAMPQVSLTELPQALDAQPLLSGPLALAEPLPNVPAAESTDSVTVSDEPAPSAAAPAPAPEAVVEATVPDTDMLELVVRRGDSLDSIFRRNGLSVADLANMLALPDAAERLRRIMPGDALSIERRGSEVVALRREISDSAILAVERTPGGFATRTIDRPIEIRVVGRHGTIRSSLFEAAMAAEIPDRVTMDMIHRLEWDIDFMLDVRVDDSFTVLYEERWRDGERLGGGNILAAEFVNRGKPIRVVRYTDPEGSSDYYTPDGRSARKAFLRAPLEFTRISGNFNPNRRHPILNTIRAHRGVDYAAPTGTPVRAAGDGKIIHRGPNGGYGNAVIIQHGGGITTLYAHLSKFGAPKNGSRVKQGDVIGYVGQTGLATGPHLHYEYRLNGVHRNPRTVELPPADPVAPQYRADFDNTAAAVWQQLDVFQSAFVAQLVR